MESLPRMPLAREMALWDRAAIDFGIPETMLMENAGRAIHEVAARKFGSLKNVCLFMGGGNNGGDAACVARHLQDSGANATIFSTKPLESISGSAAWHLELARKDGARFFQLPPTTPDAFAFLAKFRTETGCLPDLIVDGLLGTGFEHQLRPALLSLIGMINSLSALIACPVLAIDVPSGMNSDTGLPSPEAIVANITVTLAAAKPGLLLPAAKRYTGELFCRPIGLPAAIRQNCPASFRLLDGKALLFRSALPADSFKNVYGHVFILGGACGFTGAAHLAAAAALRSGAGLVTAVSPRDGLEQIKANWPEIMLLPAGDSCQWPERISPELGAKLKTADSIVAGPGMGRSSEAAAFLEQLLRLENRPPAVFDADALFLLSRNETLCSYLTERDVLTPHPGEAAFLLGSSGPDIQKNRFDALDRLCSLSKAAVILKGAATIAGQGRDLRLLCPYDLPGLAIGGAGDVLAGCLGALLGSRLYAGISTLSKAGLAVIMHAMAGLKLEQEYRGRGFLASQLADALPLVRSHVAMRPEDTEGVLPWPRLN